MRTAGTPPPFISMVTAYTLSTFVIAPLRTMAWYSFSHEASLADEMQVRGAARTGPPTIKRSSAARVYPVVMRPGFCKKSTNVSNDQCAEKQTYRSCCCRQCIQAVILVIFRREYWCAPQGRASRRKSRENSNAKPNAMRYNEADRQCKFRAKEGHVMPNQATKDNEK